MVTEQEDFIVTEPYQPTNEEMQSISEVEDKGLVADDWNSAKRYIKSFKDHLLRDMYEKQNKLCAYCRMHISLACNYLHREHVVYKDEHPQWMFLPKNLCVSCPVCNVYKGKEEVLKNPKTKTYPNSGDGFKIIHPMYDKYSDHIELIGGILYKGKTVKGIFTINTCHLYRVELAEERVDMKMIAEHKGDIIAELIGLLKLPDSYVDDRNQFNKIVTDIVEKYKEEQAKA